MNFGILFCLLIAHLISDFPLQFSKIVELRYNSNWKISLLGNSIHIGIHFIVSAFSVIYFWSPSMFFIVILISLSHVIVDFIKSFVVSRRPFLKYSILLFLLDQLSHFVLIFLLLYIVNMNPPISSSVNNLINRVVSFFSYSLAGITYNQRLILSFLLLVMGLWGVGMFIRIFFNKMDLKPYKGAINLKLELVSFNKKDGATDGGYIIGMLERLFIISSMVFNIPSVIGFILTAKSVARLKKFDDDRFVEIFIIGSFISFISAIIIGYMIRQLKILPY